MQGDWQDIQQGNEQHDIHIDPLTARTRWRGEQMDYGIAIDILLARARRAESGQKFESVTGA
jgi:hypothetical protein